MILYPHAPRWSGKSAFGLLLLLAACVFSSCSPRSNTAAGRRYQAFITRYNIYYNGQTYYAETLDLMERDYPDDYSQLLAVHPSHVRGLEGVTPPSGDFTRSIEKAQKAIQLRSIKKRPRRRPGASVTPERRKWLNREEYNPFIHNAWLLLGRSQFMNGDYLGASSTFIYIAAHFDWLPEVVTESRIWLARCYCCMGWLFEASAILDRINPGSLKSREVKLAYALTLADVEIRSRDFNAAVAPLSLAASLSRGAMKPRLLYLLGQVCRENGDLAAAREAFGKVASSNTVPYAAKINARVALAELVSPADRNHEIKSLRRITRYERNSEYLDRIFYAMGNLRLAMGDTLQAVRDYQTAVARSSREGMDQALARLALGRVYFSRRDFIPAADCYSRALPVLPENFPGLDSLRRRSDVLDRLAVFARNVRLQDSLLRLAAMSPDDRLQVVDGIIAGLKKKMKEDSDSAARRNYFDSFASDPLTLDTENPSALPVFGQKTDGLWYFYHPLARKEGRAEFQRIWGSRKLEDDWRRRNKAHFSFGEDAENEDIAVESDVETPSRSASSPLSRDYYLAAIPSAPAQIAQAQEIIQDGLYNMALILRDELNDWQSAISLFNQLLERFPDTACRLEVYRILYLTYWQIGDYARAEEYRSLILSDFPSSPVAQAMLTPDYIGRLRAAAESEERLYAEAYDDYLANRNDLVHSKFNVFSEMYSMSGIMPKFMFIDALSYVSDNKPDMFRKRLAELIERYPGSDVSPLASDYVKGLDSGRKLVSDGLNIKPLQWNVPLAADSVSSAVAPPFDLDPDSEQLLIFLFPTGSVSANDLLFRVARHNFSTFVVRDFDLEQMNFGTLGLLIVRGFDNVNQVNHYRKVMARSSDFVLPEKVRPVVISKSDFDALISGGYSFDDYFRFVSENPLNDYELEQ